MKDVQKDENYVQTDGSEKKGTAAYEAEMITDYSVWLPVAAAAEH